MTQSDLDIQPLLDKESRIQDDDVGKHHKSTNGKNKNNNSKKPPQRKDINRNVVATSANDRRFSFSRKAQKLRYLWKRKSLLYLLAIALLIVLANLTINWNGDDDDDDPMGSAEDIYFTTHLHSHVPGMKEQFTKNKSKIKNKNALPNLISSNSKTPPKSQSTNFMLPAATAPSNTSTPERKRMSVDTASTRKQSQSKINSKTNSKINSNSNSNSKNAFIDSAGVAKLKAINDPASDNKNNKNYNRTTSQFHDNLSLNSSKSLFPPSVIATNTFGNDSLSLLSSTPPEGYLVWNEFCKMPNLDPYLPEVMKHFHREKYKPCSILPPLTRLEFNRTSQRYVLRIDDDALPGYSKTGRVDCCYQSILRDSTGPKADKEIRLAECMTFYDGTSLAPTIDNILVKCRSKNKQVYINGYPMMPERQEIRERLNLWKKYDKESGNNAKPPSVLMIGIDSISRVNLIRAMPKTARYLYENEWYEMSGFNKIDDNTFPNIMAVLTGMNLSTVMRECSPYKMNALNDCDIIWKTFREHGYVTAYAEDQASINTFTYLKMGFNEKPVDYYLRPFLLGAEKHLETRLKERLINCLGYKHEADFVYDYAVEMAQRYKNDTFFGLFWANTFSHNYISASTGMDQHIVDYLKKFKQMGTMDNTIVIFFSDHGMRFGPTRNTYSGHLEERLPFLFLWIPPKMKEDYPNFVNALTVNKNRLTNPYDTHMTLKHILSLTRRVKDPKRLSQSSACPKCQSLLEPVPQNRSCTDAAIELHWCACLLYENIYKNSKTVVNLTRLLVDYINQYVHNYRNQSVSKLCVTLQLDSVESAYHSTQLQHDDDGNTSTVDIYRVTFYTKPNKGLFEATATYDPITGAMDVTGEISRLNSYISDSDCVPDGGAKKYCSCAKKIF